MNPVLAPKADAIESQPRLSDRQRIAWLRLIRTPNVGPVTFRELVNRFGSAEQALQMLLKMASSGGANHRVNIPSEQVAKAELSAVRAFGADVVAIGEAGYPPMLRKMDQPPPLVTVKGTPGVFALPATAIVGARNASLAGIKMAQMLATDLGKAGYCVVSGMARGIDTAAHRGALPTGTVAVLAGGIDKPYPAENAALAQDIAERGGAVITEMPFGWEPRAKDFPRRNRLIAGLSLGLVVVEAAVRSGSLISARLAGEMGRQVFAAPGSPLDPRTSGSNGLLKEGAVLVTEVADIIEQLAPMTSGKTAKTHQTELAELYEQDEFPLLTDADRNRVVEALGPTPVAIDEVIRHSGLRPASVLMTLLELDLAGRLERHSGGAVSLATVID